MDADSNTTWAMHVMGCLNHRNAFSVHKNTVLFVIGQVLFEVNHSLFDITCVFPDTGSENFIYILLYILFILFIYILLWTCIQEKDYYHKFSVSCPNKPHPCTCVQSNETCRT